MFYQYANRLAHQCFLKGINNKSSILVFLYFLNSDDMLGPMSEAEWRGASRLIHAVLSLPPNLEGHGVFDVFLDVRLLQDAAQQPSTAKCPEVTRIDEPVRTRPSRSTSVAGPMGLE